jgi:glycosyltransferase involved in cell wall biosynthesis
VTTIVIPAHNESQVIGRLLRQIVPTPPDDEFDIVVVANGCTDGTAEVAARFGPNVRVLSIPIASKYAALAAGDSAADGSAADFPRVYIDADVELRAEDIRALAMALRQPGVLAAAPDRILDLVGRPWTVRWYYDVWERLPEVRRGMFGRGVFGVNEAGYQRLVSLPQLLADDLAASLSFAPHERVIVPDARVIFHISRTFSDMLRRRVRAATGVAQIERTERAPASVARTRMSDLIAIIRGDPRMAPRVVLFLSVTAIARLRSRRAVARGDYTTWLRDESSRCVAADEVIAAHGSAQRHQID